MRFILAAALDHPISRIRVLAPDIEGGFGQKIPVGREEIALCAAAQLLGKPVKWSEDRIENLTAAGHAREETVEAELALLDDGSILGMRARMTLDHGAYPCLPVPAPAYIVHGDTRITPFHLLGTGGSRAATMASGAAIAAVGLLQEKVLHLASAELGVAVDELDITAGEVRGGGRAKTLAEIASAAYFGSHTKHLEGEPGLQAAANYVQPDGGGWTTATHACVVEIDPATGIVRIPRYVVVEDCGRMINPAIVDGQIRGGVVQGIGQTLLEHAAYDEDGQFLTATFMDYLLPTATDAPTIQIEHLDPAGLDEHDFRAVGEGGTIAAPAALVNAVANALGVAVTRLPLDPERVLGLVDRSNASATHR